MRLIEFLPGGLRATGPAAAKRFTPDGSTRFRRERSQDMQEMFLLQNV